MLVFFLRIQGLATPLDSGFNGTTTMRTGGDVVVVLGPKAFEIGTDVPGQSWNYVRALTVIREDVLNETKEKRLVNSISPKFGRVYLGTIRAHDDVDKRLVGRKLGLAAMLGLGLLTVWLNILFSVRRRCGRGVVWIRHRCNESSAPFCNVGAGPAFFVSVKV